VTVFVITSPVSGVAVMTYSVTLEPPERSYSTGDHVTETKRLPDSTEAVAGASGSAATSVSAEAVDAGLAPAPFSATTVNVYVCPLVSPVNVAGLSVAENVTCCDG
jgi:hypothetical protein